MAEPLTLVPPAKAEVDKDLVSRLEYWLELARKGEIAGYAIIAVNRDETTTSSFSASDDRLKVIGAVDWLRYRMLKAFDES